jgi:hypothetical protein
VRSFSAILALLFLAPTVLAQNTTLRGRVVDQLGTVIPNARITLNGQNGKERAARSNTGGEFSISNLPPGSYKLTVAFKGFRTHVEEEIKTPFADSPLKIVMTVATVSETLETKAEGGGASVEPDQNLTATVLGEEFIRNLPDNEEDLRAFLQALAGPAAAGQGGAQILVDGFGVGRLPPREAIQQIRINQNPFSAEFENAGFSRIEIITKPGSGEWRGGGGFGYRNSALDARNAFALKKPDFSLARYNFNLGGPLIKKKLSFFFFGDRSGNQGSGTTVATTLDGQVASNVPTSAKSFSLGLRVDYLLDNKSTLNIGYDRRKSASLNGEFRSGGGSSYLLPERGSDSTNSNQALRLGYTRIINSRLINEARLQYQRQQSALVARTQGVAINVLDSFNGGGSPCCPNESRNETVELQDYLTLTHKSHTVRAGAQFYYENVRSLSRSNFMGTYTFSNLAEYRIAVEAAGTPLARAQQFTINRGDSSLLYKNYTAGFFVQDDLRLNKSLSLSLGLREEFQSHLRDRNNWSPRVGVAWSPFKDRKTTLRGGAGLFHGRLSGGTYANTLRFDGERQKSLIIRNALYPDPFAGDPEIEVAAQNRRKYTLDPDLKAPYTINFNLAIERQLPGGLVGTLSYIHMRGVHQFRLRNINAPPAGSGLRPMPNEGDLYQIEATARSVFDGVIFGFNRRFSRRLMFFGSYSLSRTMSDSDGAGGLPADNHDLRPEWGRAALDRRHSFSTGFFLTLPLGFRVNSTINASSGTPFNITTGMDNNGDLTANDRPAGINRNSDLPARFYSRLPDRLICPPGMTPSGAAGACDPGGAPPVQLRDFLAQHYPDGVKAVGPGSFNVNLYASKTFGLGKRKGRTAQVNQSGSGGGQRGAGGGESARLNLTFTAGCSNLFNRVNFGHYGSALGSAYFGLPSSAGPARQIDFNLRFSF